MNYDSFLDKAKTEAENRFPGIEAETKQVDKLQGESYKGLLVRFKGSDVGVTMNLTSAFEMAQKRPNSLGAILNDVMAEIKKALRDIPRIDPSHFMNYAAAKNKLVMQVIPAKILTAGRSFHRCLKILKMARTEWTSSSFLSYQDLEEMQLMSSIHFS